MIIVIKMMYQVYECVWNIVTFLEIWGVTRRYMKWNGPIDKKNWWMFWGPQILRWFYCPHKLRCLANGPCGDSGQLTYVNYESNGILEKCTHLIITTANLSMGWRIRAREARLSMVITHLRMALSSATSATVVAPFTTNRPSVAPIADLLREGRGKATDHRVDWVNCQHVHPISHIVQKRCQILLSYESLVLEISCCHTLRDGGWWWWWWRSWWSWWWFDLYIDLNA